MLFYRTANLILFSSLAILVNASHPSFASRLGCTDRTATFVVPPTFTPGKFDNADVFHVDARADMSANGDTFHLNISITITHNTDGSLRYILTGTQYPEDGHVAWITDNNDIVAYVAFDKAGNPISSPMTGLFRLHGKGADGKPIVGSQAAMTLSAPFGDIAGVKILGGSFTVDTNDNTCHELP